MIPLSVLREYMPKLKDEDLKEVGPVEYDQSKVPEVSKKHAENVRRKAYLPDMTESFARGVEYAGLIANEAVNISDETKERQDTVETQFNSIQQEMTDKDVISAPEIIAARNGKDTLKDSIDSVMENALLNISHFALRPSDFGAKGDGVTDDTQALREAIYTSHTTGKVLFFPAGANHIITGPLNYYNGAYYNVTLNIVGSLPSAKGEYALSTHGGVKLNAEGAIFKNATIKGSIRNMSFVGSRNEKYLFFENCLLNGTVITQNNITNFGVFMYDTGTGGVTRIFENQLLTVFQFHKYKSVTRGLTDSFVTNNYINGGAEPVDNSCFEFDSYNGSVVQGNFIDYYHTIYRSKIRSAYQGPTSIGNHYQVFMYLYDLEMATGGSFFSSGDAFNWTDKTKIAHLTKYKEREYVGDDGVTYTVPTHIYQPKENFQISIKDAYIQWNVGNVVYIKESLTQYEASLADANFIGVNKFQSGKISFKKGNINPFYNSGNGPTVKIEPYFVVEVTELPNVKIGWSPYPNGTRVRFNKQEYRAINKYNTETASWVAKWVEVD